MLPLLNWLFQLTKHLVLGAAQMAVVLAVALPFLVVAACISTARDALDAALDAAFETTSITSPTTTGRGNRK